MKWTKIEGLRGLRRVGGVYCVRHGPSGRVLVSESGDVARRLWDQQQRLRLGRHFNVRLQEDYDADPSAVTFWLVRKCGMSEIRKLIKYHEVMEARAKGLAYNVSACRCRGQPSRSGET